MNRNTHKKRLLFEQLANTVTRGCDLGQCVSAQLSPGCGLGLLWNYSGRVECL
jgi:hypothetical protein